MRRAAIIGAAIVALSAAGFAVFAQSESDEASVDGLSFLGEPVTTADIAAGQTLYAENCASCHGAKLEGQPDWRRRLDNGHMPAPPHDETGHTWHHSDRNLFIVTKKGIGAVVPGYESDMPVFEGLLTDDEIADVLSYIKSTWPDRERTFQAEVSANEGDK
ncbi:MULTISPECIES: c-type cytochrome [Tritonibacter]|uniref:Cytochrome c6 n=2 Tax=Tritonibacter TaxID=2083206 RepID=A0A132C0K6_9RHOB|nr:MULTISPECIES: cytochrome c [Tritonibacter]ANP43563.1 cytochrome C [Tritonibacter mobilis F1926]KUP93647.1 cytochrome c6 [Tritonibacter horizontis]